MTPIPCKVRSAPDLVPPGSEYLNCRCKKFPKGSARSKIHAPMIGEERRYKVWSALDLAGDGGNLPLPCAR